LSSDKILTIHPAKNGDIWIGTEQGINRYNGVFEEGFFYGPVNSILESSHASVGKIRFETERNRPIESATALDPVPAQAKVWLLFY
jgi:hypothetical protein